MEEQMMTLIPKDADCFDGKNPKSFQLMKQSLDTYYEVGKSTQTYSLECVNRELEKMAKGEVLWKKVFLKDTLWDSKSEIEIMVNPVHMAIILGNEDLALQIYERWRIAYEKDEIMELVRYSTMKGNVLKMFSIMDLFVAFASDHEIWGNFLTSLNKKRNYSDDVIFNNVFIQYKADIIFPISDEVETLLIERIRTMDRAIPGFFNHSELMIDSDSVLIYQKNHITILQKIYIFMEALQGSERVIERLMETYLQEFAYICSVRDIHFNLELNELMEKMESFCNENERLERFFFCFLLVLVAKQDENVYFGDCVNPFFLPKLNKTSTETMPTFDHYKEWAKKRKLNLNIANYYNLVKNLYMNDDFAVRMTDVFNLL